MCLQKSLRFVCNVERPKTLLLLCCRKSEDHRSEDDTTDQTREHWLVAEATQTKSCKNFSELIIYKGVKVDPLCMEATGATRQGRIIFVGVAFLSVPVCG